MKIAFSISRMLLMAGIIVSCHEPVAQKNKSAADNVSSAAATEGKDYLLLKRHRMVDQKGFNQPVEAVSFMLPASWKVSSNIEWNPLQKCFPDMVQASLQAASPQGDFELMVFPATQFDWSTDPIQLDAMQKGFYKHSCTIAEPQDASGYINNMLAPSIKARVQSANVIPALQQQMDAGASQMTQQARSAGNMAYSHQGSAAEGQLIFEDGKEGMAFCTVMQTMVDMPGTQGGTARNIQCYVSMRMVMKYAVGKKEEARKIMSVFFSSARMNPQWTTGVQAYFAAVTSNAQNEMWKEIQISHAAQQEISNNIVRNWESKNNNSANNSNPTEGFGQYLRGVENWTDEGGNKVELTSGYSNAWSAKDGSYILSNDPSFDPNTISGETQSWNKMNRE